MKFGVVIFPTHEIQNVVNDYRKRYDPHYALIAPHITLKDSFELEESQLPKLVNTLRSIASESKPFTLEAHKISHFHPNSNTIYLAVHDEPNLLHLHEQLHKSPLLEQESKYSFIPHITLGQKMPDDELHDIYNRLQMRKFSYTFEVNRFHLLYQLENLTWAVHETVILGE